MKTLKLSTNRIDEEDDFDYTVARTDNGGEEYGTITTPDHVIEYCERWDIQLQEIVIDVTHEGQDLCKVFDSGFDYSAVGEGGNCVANTNKFHAIVKFAYYAI